MTAQKTVFTIYTGAALVAPLQKMAQDILPDVRFINVLDDSLIADVRASGRMTADVLERIHAYCTIGADMNVDVIWETCSSVGESVDHLQPFFDIPVLRIDRPMIEKAVNLGEHIAVLATLPTTLEPTMRLVRKISDEQGRDVEIVNGLADGAFQALTEGDHDTHDRLLLETACRVADRADVIVLAQGSMARMEDRLAEQTGTPVLGSLRIGLESLAEIPVMNSDRLNERELKDMARDLRQDVLEMIYDVKDGHPGPAYSAMDIITAVYFGGVLKFRPDQPDWPERDRFVLSKGHACPAVYAALIRLGVLGKDEKLTLRRIGSRLQGHPEMTKTPGIEATTGPLGNGLGMAVGMAKALRLQNKASRVFVLTGDGELQEGIVWESLMTAVKHELGNLCVLIDANGRQSGGLVAEVGGLMPMKEILQAFQLAVRSIDGHNFVEILDSLEWALRQDRPSAIICNTVKGKGLDYMEDDNSWHKRTPTEEQYIIGLEQLSRGAT